MIFVYGPLFGRNAIISGEKFRKLESEKYEQLLMIQMH